jgi:uncharacterized phage protein (TIGR01671 family)
MNREILFRGKSIDDGKWVEGYLLKIPSPIQWGYSSPWFIDVPPQDPDGAYARFNVDEKTIGQYTGLCDKNGKNGKKIFEGDCWIDTDGDYLVYVVEFRNAQFCFACYGIKGMLMPYGYDEYAGGFGEIDCCPMTDYNIDTIEIIGNIHDNPELLKGE